MTRRIVKVRIVDVLLEPGDVLCMSEAARWEWTHQISAREHDVLGAVDGKDAVGDGVVLPRERRVSLTFRRLCDV